MSKIDFAKVEERISQAIQTIFVKKILNGRALLSARALDFYNLNDGPRPKPRDTLDTVFEEEDDIEAETEENAHTTDEITDNENSEDSERVATYAEINNKEDIPTIDDENTTFPETFYIQKHLDWFQKKKIKTIHQTLDISEQALDTLIKKENPSDEEKNQIREILIKLKQLKEDLLKKEGLHSDQKIIEKERKKHKTKRFNVREKWLPL